MEAIENPECRLKRSAMKRARPTVYRTPCTVWCGRLEAHCSKALQRSRHPRQRLAQRCQVLVVACDSCGTACRRRTGEPIRVRLQTKAACRGSFELIVTEDLNSCLLALLRQIATFLRGLSWIASSAFRLLCTTRTLFAVERSAISRWITRGQLCCGGFFPTIL